MCWHEVIHVVNSLEITWFRSFSKRNKIKIQFSWKIASWSLHPHPQLSTLWREISFLIPILPTSGATASACASFCSCGKVGCFQGEEKSDKKNAPPKRSVQIGITPNTYQYIPSTFLTHHDVSSLWPTQLPTNTTRISPWPVAIAAPSWILYQVVFVALLLSGESQW